MSADGSEQILSATSVVRAAGSRGFGEAEPSGSRARFRATWSPVAGLVDRLNTEPPAALTPALDRNHDLTFLMADLAHRACSGVATGSVTPGSTEPD